MLSDSLKVEIVNNLEIEPLAKTIYFQGDKNSFRLSILHGSGQFSVTLNDSSIAEVHHQGRDVKIVPYQVGSIRIKVQDVELPESQPVYSELRISDVATLRLDSDGYLIE